VDLEFVRDVKDLPVALLRFVLGLVDLVVVVFLRDLAVEPWTVESRDHEDNRRTYRYTTGAAARTESHFLRPPRAICMVSSGGAAAQLGRGGSVPGADAPGGACGASSGASPSPAVGGSPWLAPCRLRCSLRRFFSARTVK